MTLLSLDDKEDDIRYRQYTEESKSEENHSMKHNFGNYNRNQSNRK
jgi:hypothetical protein